MLVDLPGRQGVAKLISADEVRCTVSVFKSASRSDQIELPLQDISRAFLSPQTRVYVRRGDAVRVGRIKDYLQQVNGLIDYEVKFPNGATADFSELDLFVRPWDAPEDPAESLAVGGAESQYLHDRRQAALGPLRALRSACQGLTALASAGVDLVPHQVAAVRRVLTDPVQRYLLADEVGLGKTIEAGLIIRQHLIDDPETTVLIVVPEHLRDQWRSELRTKLRLDQFAYAFEVIAHEDLSRVTRAPDILVVDEAHHLVGVIAGDLEAAAGRLATLSREATVLLLLSATPPLGEEARFLALLNLLDPETHPLNDVDGFRAKLEQRRDIGRLLLGLDADSPGLVLRQRGQDMVRLFPQDAEIARLAPRLVDATREDPEAVPALCAALRTHVADTYRVHQRLIRSRRADAQGWEFRPRGPAAVEAPSLAHMRTESDPDPHTARLAEALEEWRFSAVEATFEDREAQRRAAGRYRDLLEKISEGDAHLPSWLAHLEPLFDDESDTLAKLTELALEQAPGQRIETMVESTVRLLKTLAASASNPKIVVFASSASTARAFHEAFAQIAPQILSALLLRETDGAAIAAAFVNARNPFVLVSDRAGEEGLNLSCGDAIVHLDLPGSTARLEQRIGRLDRFGRKQGIIRHRILLPSDEEDSPWQAWLDLVAEGLLIFNASISDVQFLLEDIEAEAGLALFVHGPGAIAAQIVAVRARVAEERRSQQEQYALDRLALAEIPIDPFILEMDDAEADEAALEAGVEAWLVGVLQLKRRPAAWPDADPFTLRPTPTTLIPKRPWLDQLSEEERLALTWRRRVATRFPQTTLLRPGTPLIDLAERYTRWDDRGTAFMTWRTLPDWTEEPWMGFRLCFVIEPGLAVGDLLSPTAAERAMSRRAQQYFQVQSETLYIDINGATVSDPSIIELLSGPYRKAGEGARYSDTNLGSRRSALDDLIDRTAFEAICRSVRDGAADALSRSESHRARTERAVEAAEADLSRHERRLTGQGLKTAHEIDLLRAILPGLKSPSVRLDAMGLFVISASPPVRVTHAPA